MTTAEELTQVETAIAAILAGGQSYSIDGSLAMKQANLSTLYARKELLTRRLAREQGHSPRVASADFSGLR